MVPRGQSYVTYAKILGDSFHILPLQKCAKLSGTPPLSTSPNHPGWHQTGSAGRQGKGNCCA